MSDKRKVHDILAEHGDGPNGQQYQRRPVAFIQHGNREDGNTYEGICPWCGATLCYVPGEQTRVIGGLYRILLSFQKRHWLEVCSQRPSILEAAKRQEFAVEVTDKPLNTEKPITFQ